MSTTMVLANLAASDEPGSPVVIRRTAGYHPSVWGDRFINYASDDDDTMSLARKEQRIKEVKEEVKRELLMAVPAASEPSSSSSSASQKLLNLIDVIQRLGVAYHFEKEIEEALQHIYHTYDHDDDLRTVSLRFRLLRQEGFDVSSDVFDKFKDEKGNFKECLTGDIMGMLDLYEAAHLMKHGDNILDEAMTFTVTHLRSYMATITTNLCHSLTQQIMDALKQPIRKGIPRLEARHYISIYEQDGNSHNNQALLEFAKLDFNQLQSLHKKELSDITRWWKSLDFANKLPFARDRIVECYFWALGVYFEPQYYLARRIFSKVIAMASVIDDIYDAYGTIEELELFTDAIDRWNISCIDQLPEYMKLCYRALLDVYEEMEEEMAKRGQLYRVCYAKEAMKKLVQAYFVEAKWFQEDYIPTMEEYMANALVSTGYYMLATMSLVGMGDIVTEEAFDWFFKDPKIVRASAMICRLMDDIVSNKFEQERGHVVSGIECYMKQYNVTEKQVHDEFRIQVVNAWRDINQECLRPFDVPMPLLMRPLNLARVMDVVYKDEDGYTHVGIETQKRIASLLIDPMPM